MLSLCPRIFLTLVLVGILPRLSLASPTEAPVEIVPMTQPTEDGGEQHADRLQSVDVAAPPAESQEVIRNRKLEYYFPFRQAMSPRAGAIYDLKRYAEDGQLLYLLGIQYLWHTQELKAFEAGADLISDGTGVAHFSRVRIYSRGRFRPYSKWGGGVRIIPKDGLITFLKTENLQGRAAIGFEHLLAPPMSLRFDAEATISLQTVQALVVMGYSWAW